VPHHVTRLRSRSLAARGESHLGCEPNEGLGWAGICGVAAIRVMGARVAWVSTRLLGAMSGLSIVLASSIVPVALGGAVVATLADACHAQYKAAAPWDAAIRELRVATSVAPDGSHHPRLVALRQLRDPTLKPLFQSLVQGSHWTIQIDGILGLAELDPKGMVDPFLLGQLKGENDRSTAIGAACGLDMVGVEQAQAMLGWDDLSPRDRILLLAELFRRGGTPDVERIKALVEHRNDEVSGVATLLLATITKDPAPVEKFRTRFGALQPRDRGLVLGSLADAAARFRLTGGSAFLHGSLQDATLAAEAKFAAIASLLQVEPALGYADWKQAVEGDPSQASRVRLALLILASEQDMSGASAVRLPKDAGAPLRQIAAGETLEPLLAKLADAIDALGGGADATKAFPALVQTRHRAALNATLDVVKRLGSDAQRATYEAFADLITGEDRTTLPNAVGQLAVDALSRLGALDPAAVGVRLEKASARDAEDARLQELLLLALLQTNTKEAATVAMKARPTVSRRGAAMALLLHARFAERLERSDVDELGVIASGGWSLDPGLEIQAAWLYARHSGRADEAIATILKPSS
jgi:hypothetical protein